MLEHRTFDSFGKPTSTWAADYLFGLDGMPYDPPSGTYTPDNSRPYDPATGRFLSEDPTVPRPDQNLYRWCGNNALNETDPSGRCGYGASYYTASNSGTSFVPSVSNTGLSFNVGRPNLQGVATILNSDQWVPNTQTGGNFNACAAGIGLNSAANYISGQVPPASLRSEIDVGRQFGLEGNQQSVFLDGEQLDGPRRVKGSSVPEYYDYGGTPDLPGQSYEVKSFNLSTEAGQQNMVYKTVNQAVPRAGNLPEGSVQNIIIDARGQTVTLEQMSQIRQALEAKSGGVIQAENVSFMQGERALGVTYRCSLWRSRDGCRRGRLRRLQNRHRREQGADGFIGCRGLDRGLGWRRGRRGDGRWNRGLVWRCRGRPRSSYRRNYRRYWRIYGRQ